MTVKVIDKDTGWTRFFKAAEALRGGSYAKVGVLADDTKGGLHHTDPDTGKSSPLTVAEIAAVLEYGTEDGRVPARPFLRSTFEKQAETLVSMAAQVLLKICFESMPVGQGLSLMGAKLAAEVKKAVTTGPHFQPENAPSTIMRKVRKGRTARLFSKAAKTLGQALAQAGALAAVRPLVDTGRMINALTWVVVMGAFAQGGGAKGSAPVKGDE